MDISKTINSAVEALQEDRWSDYNEIAWQAGVGNDGGGRILEVLAKRHPEEIDLIACVGKCAQAHETDALRRLLKAVSHLEREAPPVSRRL